MGMFVKERNAMSENNGDMMAMCLMSAPTEGTVFLESASATAVIMAERASSLTALTTAL